MKRTKSTLFRKDLHVWCSIDLYMCFSFFNVFNTMMQIYIVHFVHELFLFLAHERDEPNMWWT